MSAGLLEYLQTVHGQAAIVSGVTTALKDVNKDLSGGLLGGTELAFRITAVNRHLDVTLPTGSGHYKSLTPDPEHGQYDYVVIAEEKERWTLTSGVTTREGIIRAFDDHYQWYGNVLVYLGDDAGFQLVVSCSGLSEDGDEMYAGLLAFHIKRELLLGFARYQLAA